jgi:MFS family permease
MDDTTAKRESAGEPGYWPWVPVTFIALRHRNYRLYWLGQIVSLVGTWMQRTAQGWLVTDLVLRFAHGAQIEPLTDWWVAVVSAAAMLPVLFISPFAGVLADYFDKRHIIIWTQSLMAVQAVVLAWLAYTNVINIPWIIILALALGVISAIDVPARQGMAIELVGRQHLPNAIAINSGVFNSARVIGPAITGVMLAMHFTVAHAFILNAVSFIAVIAALVMMRGDFASRAEGSLVRGAYLRRTADGFRYLVNASGVRRISIMIGVIALLVNPFVALLPSIARYQLGVGPAQFGFLVTSFGAGAVLGSFSLALLSGRRLHHHTLRIGYVLLIGAVIVLTQLHSIWFAYATLAVAGLGFNWVFADSNTMIQLHVPDEMRGRAMGVYSMLNMGMYPVGTLIIGWAAKHYGASNALLVGSLITAVICAVLFIGRPLHHPENAEKA